MLSASFLAYRGQHPYLTLTQTQVINDSDTTALPTPRQAPSKLPNATRAANHIPCFGILRDGSLERRVFVVGEVVVNALREQLRFDERQHEPLYVRDVSVEIPGCPAPDPFPSAIFHSGRPWSSARPA
jgi:hypothetical protein